MKRLIVVVLLAALTTPIFAYDPPTDEELNDWWARLSRVERLEQLRKLDEIEHLIPDVDRPALVLITTGDKARAYWEPEPQLTVRVGDHLEYVLSLPEAETDVVSGQTWSRQTWFGLGVGTGVVASILLAVALR